MIFREFANKSVLITGGASGLGKALGKVLVASLANVILLDNDQKALQTTLEELGRNVIGKVVDVTNFSLVQQAVLDAKARFGSLDYIFNNAAITLMGEVRDMTIEDWDNVLNVDLKGVVNGVVASYALMCEQQSGHIVNISSIAGITPAVMTIPYTVSKFGVVGLSHSLRLEAKALGVKVSVACPNLINTSIWLKAKVLASQVNLAGEFLPLFPHPPLIDPENAANIILKGVVKNKATILNGGTSRFVWWSYRFFPTIWMWVYDQFIMKKFRALRRQEK